MKKILLLLFVSFALISQAKPTPLDEYRKQIDALDKTLAKAFEERMKVSYLVAKYKLENNLPILNLEREKQVLEKNTALLSPEFQPYGKKFFQYNMDLSKEYQNVVFANKKDLGAKSTATLDDFRKQIDALDKTLAKAFEERMKVSYSVAKYKLENNLPILNLEREKQVLEKNTALLSSEFQPYGKKFFQYNMDLSKEYQNVVFAKKP